MTVHLLADRLTTVTAVDIAAGPPSLSVELIETAAFRTLVVRLGEPHEVLSWAIVNGGRTKADAVVWREVRLGELGPTVDPDALLKDTIARVGAPGAVGLLTARDVRRYEIEGAEREGVKAECLATVGLGNLLAVGDPQTEPRASVGTINLVCRVSVGVTEEALLEAMSIATEARTAAVLASGLRSPVSGRRATGTGTDCIVIAAPASIPPQRFAGKHTPCGSAIGAAVFGAVSRGVERWLEDNPCPAT